MQRNKANTVGKVYLNLKCRLEWFLSLAVDHFPFL